MIMKVSYLGMLSILNTSSMSMTTRKTKSNDDDVLDVLLE